MNDIAVDVCQTIVATAVAVRKAFVINPIK